MFKQVNYLENNVYLSIHLSDDLTKKRFNAVMGRNNLLCAINHFVQQMATDTTNPLQMIQNYLQRVLSTNTHFSFPSSVH